MSREHSPGSYLRVRMGSLAIGVCWMLGDIGEKHECIPFESTTASCVMDPDDPLFVP